MEYRKQLGGCQEIGWAIYAAMCLLLLLAIPGVAGAQDFDTDPVTVTGAPSAEGAAPGGALELVFTVKIESGFYVYQDKLTVGLKDAPAGYVAGEPAMPPAEVKFDKLLEKEVPIYSGTITVRLPVTVAPDAAAGPATLVGEVGFQSCTESYCLMPTTIDVPVAFAVDASAAPSSAGEPPAEAAAAGAAGSSTEGGDTASKLQGAFEKDNLWLALFFCFIGGIAASLTPCVYPMIPITISVIGAKAEGGKLKGFILSLFYVLGIAITYSVAGMAAAKTGAVFGTILQNPWVVGGIAAVFVLMALAMFGAFELQVPTSVSSRMGGYQGKGVFGVLAMGAITGLVASPCVGPVLVVLLTFVAQTQSVFIGFILLFTFAVGMGLLFILIGTFSGILVNLPKSGTWMVAVRNIFGVLMILVAFYYIHPLTPDWLFALLLGAFLLLTGLVTGWPGTAGEPPAGLGQVWARGFRKTVGFLGVILGIYLIVGTLLAHGFLLPPMNLAGGAGGAVAPDAGIDWLHDEPEALARARDTGKPLIIDFTAEWCMACKELEAFTFSDPEVQAELKARFVSAKIDCTEETEDVKRLFEKYNVRGLPLIVFYDSRGELLADERVIGFIDKDEMLAILRGID